MTGPAPRQAPLVETPLEVWQRWAEPSRDHEQPFMVPVEADVPLIDDCMSLLRMASGLAAVVAPHCGRMPGGSAAEARYLVAVIRDIEARYCDRVSMIWHELGDGHPQRRGFEHDFSAQITRKDTK